MKVSVALRRAAWVLVSEGYCLLEAGIFGDSFGSLKDSLLGQLSWQEKCQGSLDLPGGDSGPLVVVGKTAGLISGSQSPSSRPSFSPVERVGVLTPAGSLHPYSQTGMPQPSLVCQEPNSNSTQSYIQPNLLEHLYSTHCQETVCQCIFASVFSSFQQVNGLGNRL